MLSHKHARSGHSGDHMEEKLEAPGEGQWEGSAGVCLWKAGPGRTEQNSEMSKSKFPLS